MEQPEKWNKAHELRIVMACAEMLRMSGGSIPHTFTKWKHVVKPLAKARTLMNKDWVTLLLTVSASNFDLLQQNA